jgi:hypothetical protein
MANVTKPDANPILALILTLLVFGIGHVVVNGQQRKWLFCLLATILGIFLCCVGATVISILSTIEAYQTALRLQKGETIGENEYTFVPMFKVARLLDKTATCSKA